LLQETRQFRFLKRTSDVRITLTVQRRYRNKYCGYEERKIGNQSRCQSTT